MLTLLNYPMTWWCNIFSHVLCIHVIHFVRHVFDDVIPMCVLRGINNKWRWFVSSTPNYASFCTVKPMFKVFRGHRHRGWFENKVFSKSNWCLEMFRVPAICCPHTPLHPLVTPFPNLALKEIVSLKGTLKEVKYGDINANA